MTQIYTKVKEVQGKWCFQVSSGEKNHHYNTKCNWRHTVSQGWEGTEGWVIFTHWPSTLHGKQEPRPSQEGVLGTWCSLGQDKVTGDSLPRTPQDLTGRSQSNTQSTAEEWSWFRFIFTLENTKRLWWSNRGNYGLYIIFTHYHAPSGAVKYLFIIEIFLSLILLQMSIQKMCPSQGQGNSTVGKPFALHGANPGLIPSIPWESPQGPPQRGNFWVQGQEWTLSITGYN